MPLQAHLRRPFNEGERIRSRLTCIASAALQSQWEGRLAVCGPLTPARAVCAARRSWGASLVVTRCWGSDADPDAGREARCAVHDTGPALHGKIAYGRGSSVCESRGGAQACGMACSICTGPRVYCVYARLGCDLWICMDASGRISRPHRRLLHTLFNV